MSSDDIDILAHGYELLDSIGKLPIKMGISRKCNKRNMVPTWAKVVKALHVYVGGKSPCLSLLNT